MPNDVINTITIGSTTYDIGGTGGGHVIEKSDGTDMTQRANLQFVDATLTDDSTNDRTVVENVHVIDDEDELDDLPDGIYIGDYDDTTPIDASVIAYDNTTSGLAADDVQDAIDELVDETDRMDTTTTSASGNPISIAGLKSNQLAIDPIITFEPIQAGSGIPSPDNVRAISGYDKVEVVSCGRNVLPFPYETDSKSQNGVTFTVNSDGSVSLSGTASADASLLLFTVRDDSLGGYKMTGGVSSDVYMRQRIVAKNGGAYIRDRVDTGSGVILDNIDEETEMYYILAYVKSGVNTTGMKFYPMLQLASGASDTYEPYKSATSISESLGQTVYGMEHTLRTGKARVTHGIVDLGTKDWSYHASTSSTDTNRFSISTSAGYLGDAKVPLASDIVNGKCDIYQPSSNTQNVNGGNTRTGYISVTTGGNIVITDTRFTSPSDLKAALNGIKFSYELKDENKFTIQLTPREISLLKTYAYLSTNGSNIQLSYHNGEMASLGDVSQLGETVNELGDRLNANVRDITNNNITNTASDPYEFPEDGYLVINSSTSTTGNISVAITDKNGANLAYMSMIIVGQNQRQSLYVRKGMKVYVSSNTSTNGLISYRGIVS